MKTIILPNQGTGPRFEFAYGYSAVHVSETEVILLCVDDTFDSEVCSEVPEGLGIHALRDLGIITQEEYEARKPSEKRRMAERNLQCTRERMAEVAASVERQQAELDAMEETQ